MADAAISLHLLASPGEDWAAWIVSTRAAAKSMPSSLPGKSTLSAHGPGACCRGFVTGDKKISGRKISSDPPSPSQLFAVADGFSHGAGLGRALPVRSPASHNSFAAPGSPPL